MRSTARLDDPNEFWLYETWADEESVNAHESGEAFQRYKENLRPLVDPDTLVFGNCAPIKVLGYEVPLPRLEAWPRSGS